MGDPFSQSELSQVFDNAVNRMSTVVRITPKMGEPRIGVWMLVFSEVGEDSHSGHSTKRFAISQRDTGCDVT
ncbi:hypothetical protein CDA61_17655 [Alcaligenes faecalis]|nr:hypothetical protein CDA61_17655 [Alcaligenes faecalis]